MLPATASCTPWRATRKAVGARILGSAVSDEVSLLVWMQTMLPRSRTTSWTAKSAGRSLGIDQQLAAGAVHQFARDAGGLLGLAF